MGFPSVCKNYQNIDKNSNMPVCHKMVFHEIDYSNYVKTPKMRYKELM